MDWTNKKVVVTGGAGFVGTQLVQLLVEHGAEVCVLDNFSRGRNRVDGATYDLGSAGDVLACRRVFKDAYAVFNLAAHVAGVIYNQKNHLEMFAENIRLQMVPVQAAEQCGVERFLQVSSVCVYAPDFNHPCAEEFGQIGEPAQANIAYSWSKRMGEHIALWSKIPHVVIVRPSNIYGPYDYFDERAHVIPALIQKAIDNEVIEVNGSGEESREFIYVKDIAKGMLAALEDGHHGAAYNLGTNGNTAITMKDLIALIQQATDTTHKEVRFSSQYDAGDQKRWSNALKAQEELGWWYETELADGLTETVRWYASLHHYER